MRCETIELALYVHHETEKALLVSDDGEKDNAKWLAKSLLGEHRRVGRTLEAEVPEWLAKREGWI